MRQASGERHGMSSSARRAITWAAWKARPAAIPVAFALIGLIWASAAAGESSTQPSSPSPQAEVPAALLARLRAQYIPEDANTPGTSESDKVRRYKAILREGGYAEKLYAQAPNLHEVRELMMAAAKGMATLEGTDEARQVLLDIARRLANSPAPPESRVVADTLLMRTRLDDLANCPAEAADEVGAFVARYRGTPGEAKALVAAAELCRIADADSPRKTYLRLLSKRHCGDLGIVEYLQAQGLNPNAGRLVSAKLALLDGSTLTLPRDTLGKFTVLHFWTMAKSGLIGKTSRGDFDYLALHQSFRKDGGEIVSMNLDEDRQRVARFIRDECKGMDWPQTCSGLGLKDPMFRRYFTPTMPAYWLVGPGGRLISDAYRGRGGQEWSSFSNSVRRALPQFREMTLRMPYYRSGEFLLDSPEPAQFAPPGAADIPAERLDELRRKAIRPPVLGLDKDKRAAAFRETLELGRAIEQKYPQAASLPVVRGMMLVAARWLATETPDKAGAKQAQDIAAQILDSKAQGPPRLLAEYVRASGELAGDGISQEDSAGRINALVKKHAGGDLKWAAAIFGVMLATECGDEETLAALVEALGGQVDGHPEVRGFLRGYCNENVDARTRQGQPRSTPESPSPWEVRGELPLLDGGTLRLEDLKGKMVVIHFWFTACPAITPELIAARTRIDRKTKEKRVLLPADLSPDPRYDMVIVGVNLDRSREDVEEYLERHEEYKDWIHVFSGLGRDDPLARELDIYGVPRSVLLDREGKIYRWGCPSQAISGIRYQVFAPPTDPTAKPPAKPVPGKSKIASAEAPVADLPKEISLGLGGKLAVKLALVPAGEVSIGSPSNDRWALGDEEPQQRRYLTKPFYMGVHHVTRGQFAAFVRQTDYKTDAEREGWSFVWNGSWQKVEGASWRKCGFDQGDGHPVVCVSWNDAVEFCNWLGRTSGKAVRLPTETQWEYACRAGTLTPFPWGARPEGGNGWCNAADLSAAGAAGDKRFPGLASFDWDDGHVYTSPVGKFKANAFGLHDMTGNAWQWCSDWYGLYAIRYRSRGVDPIGPPAGTYRLARGGSWKSGPDYCRSAVRRKALPAASTNTVGFRVVVEAP